MLHYHLSERIQLHKNILRIGGEPPQLKLFFITISILPNPLCMQRPLFVWFYIVLCPFVLVIWLRFFTLIVFDHCVLPSLILLINYYEYDCSFAQTRHISAKKGT